MQTGQLKPGDIVKVDKKGRIFLAEVDDPPIDQHVKPKVVRIIPPHNVSYRTATAREIKTHYRKLKS